MHLYSLCQTWLNLKTHTASETENRTSCLTTVNQVRVRVNQTITVSSCQSDIGNQCRIKNPCISGTPGGGARALQSTIEGLAMTATVVLLLAFPGERNCSSFGAEMVHIVRPGRWGARGGGIWCQVKAHGVSLAVGDLAVRPSSPLLTAPPKAGEGGGPSGPWQTPADPPSLSSGKKCNL